ncbi:hypothetical protein FA13DRAFT_1732426, partial [Coprinellus micaceus]
SSPPYFTPESSAFCRGMDGPVATGCHRRMVKFWGLERRGLGLWKGMTSPPPSREPRLSFTFRTWPLLRESQGASGDAFGHQPMTEIWFCASFRCVLSGICLRCNKAPRPIHAIS